MSSKGATSAVEALLTYGWLETARVCLGPSAYRVTTIGCRGISEASDYGLPDWAEPYLESVLTLEGGKDSGGGVDLRELYGAIGGTLK